MKNIGKIRSVGDRRGYHFYIDADGNIWQNYGPSELLGESIIITAIAFISAWRLGTAMITHKRKLMHMSG